MTGNVLVIVLSLASAMGFAVSAVLKHSTATRVPQLTGFHLGSLWKFGVATVTHPLWLTAIVADIAGVVLQIVALNKGSISVVQPILSVGLLFALALRHLGARTMPRAEIPWAALLIVSLLGFLMVSGISAVDSGPSEIHYLTGWIAVIVSAIVVVGCVAVARHAPTMQWRTMSLGIAVGILYAINAALLKTCTQKYQGGLSALVTSWAPYAVIVVGLTGIMLCQLAYQAGPLVASQPTIAVVDPLASVVIGVAIYAEALRHGWWVIPAMVVLLALMSVAIAKLAAIEPAPARTPPALQHH